MRITAWIGVAVALGASTARGAGGAVSTEEPIGEVAEAATTAGTACRVGCVGSYTALCLRVREICAVGSVVTLGSAVIPCAKAVLVTCLTTAMLAVICNDRCPP